MSISCRILDERLATLCARGLEPAPDDAFFTLAESADERAFVYARVKS